MRERKGNDDYAGFSGQDNFPEQVSSDMNTELKPAVQKHRSKIF